MKKANLSLADCYKVLGLQQNACLEDVKRAYRKRAFELHPDLNPGDGASRDFQQLNEAYVVLIRLLDAKSTVQNPTGTANASAKEAQQAYEEQARQEKERRAAERKAKQEQERQERQEQQRLDRERREQEEREKRETERREKLKQEIERQENERLARQAQAKRDKERQVEARLAAEKAREERLRQQAPRPEAHRRTYARPQPREAEASFGAARSANQERSAHTAQTQPDPQERDALLRDLLDDPFARRVYEDIYSEVQHRKQAPPNTKQNEPVRSVDTEWGAKFPGSPLAGGVGKAIKSWLMAQVDDELTMLLPASRMFPGARIRLQIRRGFPGETHTVDITLPQDFAVGKPVRLKGMGKKFGRWQGDLYLTFQIKE